ncbi:MAG: cytochrome [Thermoactinospora sp.]|nr:cytochrome [Thermoactinospora sp.]
MAYARSREGRKGPPRASVVDTVRLGAQVLVPTLLQGVILRRRAGSALAGLIDADGRATRLLRRMRAKHGDGPLLVRVPMRGWLLLPLTEDDVRRVLHDPAFHPATREKRGALAHFAPEGVLVTVDRELRGRRRRFNEQVLATGEADHPFHERFRRVVAEEVAGLPREGTLTWDAFSAAHWRIARRIVLGDAARDDEELTWLLNRLRGDANYSYVRGHRTDVRARFGRRLSRHLERAEDGSLAALVRSTPVAPDVDPDGQVPHWLFAFDAAGIAAYRALALLAGNPDAGAREAVRESVRLWPTTLAILRDSPRGAMVAIHSPYANRIEGDDFQPGSSAGVPFSDGHGRCPGEDLVMLVEGMVVEEYLRSREIEGPDLPVALPGSLDHFTLRFAVRPAER